MELDLRGNRKAQNLEALIGRGVEDPRTRLDLLRRRLTSILFKLEEERGQI